MTSHPIDLNTSGAKAPAVPLPHAATIFSLFFNLKSLIK
tara:strand:+ start:4540 stop:4656 length:117 start_codon:yes stop_codon:yes gene_type:complete